MTHTIQPNNPETTPAPDATDVPGRHRHGSRWPRRLVPAQ